MSNPRMPERPPPPDQNPDYHPPQIDFVVPTGASTLTREQLVDKIRGTLVGNGIGDAIGVITEFSSKDAVIHQYGPNFDFSFEKVSSYRFPKGDWTDDTDQCICLLDMLNEEGCVNPCSWARRLVYWIRHGFPELGDFCGMGLGGTVASSAFQKSFYQDPHGAGYQTWIERNQNAAANGAVMRTSVLGIPCFHDLETVKKHAATISRTTHWDTRCVGSCIACCTAISLMLQGTPTETPEQRIALANRARSEALEYVDPRYHETFVQHTSVSQNIEDLQLDESRAIGYTLKCIGSGFYAILSMKNFRTVINEITQEAGDADTNGAVAGAMLGCLVGYSNLPTDWLRGLKHHDWLMNKIDMLLLKMQLIDPPLVVRPLPVIRRAADSRIHVMEEEEEEL